MVQVRLMNSDADHVAEVMEILLPWLQQCPDLVVGAPSELGMKGPGSRMVFDLLPAKPRPQTLRAQAERVDDEAAGRCRPDAERE